MRWRMLEPPEPGSRPRYREYAPPPDLAPYVRCLWRITAEHAPPTPNRICPDGCADVVITGDGDVRAVGTMSTAVVLPVAGRVELLGVRFHPGEALTFFDLPLGLLTDSTALPDELGWRAARHLGDQLATTAEPAARLALFVAALRARLAGLERRAAPARFRQAVRLLEQQGIGPGVRRVRDILDMNERTLERQFAERVGLSPKAFERVARFGRALSRIQRSPRAPYAAIALAAGYADQAHFNSEFRSFAGVTPGGYAREWDAVGFVQYDRAGGA